MAYININNRIIDSYNYDSIEFELNSIIENELSKDESQVNTELVNECVDALIALEQEKNGLNAFVPLVPSEQFVRLIEKQNSITPSTWKRLSRATRVAIIAAVMASTTLTANAGINAVTGVNVIEEIGNKVMDALGISKNNIIILDTEDDDDETTTRHIDILDAEDDDEEGTTAPETTTEQETTKPHIEILDAKDDDDEETTKPPTKPTEHAVYLKQLRAEFDNFKLAYVCGEELSYDGLKLFAVYSDGKELPVKLEDCNYTRGIDMEKPGDYKLRIMYQTCVISIDITVRPDEDTRGATSHSNDDFDYLLTEKGAYITKYKGNERNINIDEIDGKEVVFIGPNAFENSSVEYVTAQNVEKIFNNAFKNSKSLVDCYTPRATYVGESAFENCEKLKEAVFSNNATYIGDSAYKKTSIEKFTLPENITEIPKSVCEMCYNLKEVELLSKPTAVNDYAFTDCRALEIVKGTENIEEVGLYAFYNNEIMEFESKPNIKIAKEGAFAFCRALDLGEQLELKEIGSQSFIYCTKLTKVKLADGVEVIPDSCFRGAHISKIEIPNSVKVIEGYALMSIEARDVILPSALEELGDYALYSPLMRNIYFNSDNIKFGDSVIYAGSRVKIYGSANSTAKSYAENNSINYQVKEDE